MPLCGIPLPVFAAAILSKLSFNASPNLVSLPLISALAAAETFDLSTSEGIPRSGAKLFILSIYLFLSMSCAIS